MNSRLMRRGRSLVLALVVSLCALAAGRSFAGTSPQGSAFSYQGRLDISGAPYSGTADFQFALWEVAAGAPQVGSTLAVNGITVNQGVFSVSLDFGALAFDGNARWVSIDVHTPSNGGIGPFTPLNPRQRIDTVPYAQYALNALISGPQPNQLALNNTANTYSGSSMSLDGGTFHVDAVNNRVGIGTTTPRGALDVVGKSTYQEVGLPSGGYDGFNLTNGTSIVGILARQNNDIWVANGVAGSVILGTWTGPNVVSDRLNVYPDGRVRIGLNSAPVPVSRLYVYEGPAGVTANAGTSLALERNGGNYLNILAPDANESGVLFGKPTGGSAAGGIIYNSAGTPDGLQFRTGGNVPRMVINSAGSVGLGGITVPAARLDVYNPQDPSVTNTVIFRIAAAGSNYSVVHNGPNGDWYIRSAVNGGQVIIQDVPGNVGIGTSSPGTKLHILNSNAAMNSLQSVNTAASGTDVASGVVGITSQANVAAGGVRGVNLHAVGTGVIGVGNNAPETGLASGSGGAFTGVTTGVYARSTAPQGGEGLYAQQFTDVVRVGFYSSGTFYKINGSGTVSTIVRDTADQPVTMFAPESPEVLFQDFGDGMLINGFAHIDLDPTFARNILVDPTHPMRVFIQLEDNEQCQGVVVKNKSATGFDVVELRGGSSNTPFTYQISGRRADETLPSGRLSRYADLRFPPAPAPEAVQSAKADPTVGQVQAALQEDRAAPR